MERASGVLCNISSLPSKFGIGNFSRDAESFAQTIHEMGFKWWQMLPLTAIGCGNSPYSGISTYAGNYLYINPYELMDINLLTHDEVNNFKYNGSPYKADYNFARWNVKNFMQIAFSRLTDEMKSSVKKFLKEQSYWLDDYAVFQAIAEKFGSKRWEWEKPLKEHNQKAIDAFKRANEDRYQYYVFEQYEFFRQWNMLKKKINDIGVKIIGDLPFYVALDSVDVWANADQFQLDGNYRPKAVAGVPPDAFSDTGQMWGNPLYDFEKMKKDDFSWWRKRVSYCFKLYDGLRLDHFRAFYNYFAIPYGEETAVNGVWHSGPKNELINLIKKDNKNAVIIAEDLGLLTPDVTEFIKKTGFPGMKIFQFAFDGTQSTHLPHYYDINCVAYTGTHDNDTLLGWLYKANEGARNFALKYCNFQGFGWGAGGPECGSTKAIIKTVIASSASLAVIPIQDLLGYGSDTRMNVPGVAEGNWEFRIANEALYGLDRAYFADINNTYGRSCGM